MLLCNVRCVNPRVTGGKRTIIMNWILNPSSLSKRRLLRMNWPTNTVPVLFLMPRGGTEPTTIARWSLIPEGESRFCQKAAAKATRPDHRHASLPRRICTDHAQFSATTVVMVRHAAPGSKADLYFSGRPGG